MTEDQIKTALRVKIATLEARGEMTPEALRLFGRSLDLPLACVKFRYLITREELIRPFGFKPADRVFVRPRSAYYFHDMPTGRLAAFPWRTYDMHT